MFRALIGDDLRDLNAFCEFRDRDNTTLQV
jgi:hypothetical protein